MARLDDIATHIRDVATGVDGLVAVYLFGSVAAGTDTRESDVDLGVLYDPPPASTLDAGPLDLEAEIERRLGRPVHLVVLNDTPPDLRIRVLRAQRLLLERDRAARVRFEVATRNEFFDLEPVLRAYRTPRGLFPTAPALVARKLAAIESGVADLRRFARPDDLDTDLLQRRFVEHTLQIAIQAALDVASHVVSDERLGEPKTNRDLFTLLAQADWIDEPLRDTMARMAGFRNVLVHGYDDVNLALVRDILERRLGDLERFVGAIRARL